jgi:hypothetical protein
MNRWRFPALSIHGIQGSFDTPGAKVVIPRKVIGKFSIRIVPNQEPERIEHLIKTYLKQKWEERQSPNQMRVSAISMFFPGILETHQTSFITYFAISCKRCTWLTMG